MEPVSFAKGSFCGYCKKSEDPEIELMSCSRCRLAKYCSTDCQKNDFSNHKNDCQWVGHFQDMMPKIEKLYSNWDGGENIFETQVGQFCEMNNRLLWEAPKSKLLKDVWPRDYIRRRCRMVEGMWEIARKHESYEATEIVLKEVLATLRLDFTDRYAVKEMAVFMFLYLGREDEAFYFLKFWCGPHSGRGFMSEPTGHELAKKNFSSLSEGDWFRSDRGNKLEDIFCSCCNTGPFTQPMGLMVGLIGIKIRILHELKSISPNAKLAKEILEDKFCTVECKKDFKSHKKGCKMANIGLREAIKTTEGQIGDLIKNLNKENSTILPALIDPKPLLAEPVPTSVNDAGPTGAHIVLLNAWKYFDMLPEGKKVIASFLYPRIPKGISAYPPYPTEEDGMVSLGNSHYQTGYVRNYVNPNPFLLGKKK